MRAFSRCENTIASEELREDAPVGEHGQTTPLIGLDHEELVIRRGRRSGVYTVVAVHSTALGPALGGCRMWRYQSSADGARDALRLSRAMTFKAAAARVPLLPWRCGLGTRGTWMSSVAK